LHPSNRFSSWFLPICRRYRSNDHQLSEHQVLPELT
jgi:hypothetical protein